MRKNIHPKYVDCKVNCGCGNSFTTRATVPELSVAICYKCHPYYTGTQKLIDATGRVERFQKRFKWSGAEQAEAKTEKGK
ncbi:MAG: 50S ribosomal protein L31 [Candidatus Brocadiia bacterium]